MRPNIRPIGTAGATGQAEEGDLIGPGEGQQGDGDAEEAAVEAHAAVPDAQDLQRLHPDQLRRVEQHIAQTPAEDDAQRDPEHQVIDLLGIGRRRRSAPEPRVAHQTDRVAPAQQDAGDIGQSVPTDRERADLDQHGVEIREFHGQSPLFRRLRRHLAE
jgi:hypothetical protein